MILISDIGNTNITVGLFEGEKKITIWRLPTDKKLSCDEYGALLLDLISNFNKNLKLEGAIVASVVTTLTDIYIDAIRKYLKVEPINFNYKIDTGIKIKTKNISEVGADRIVNAIAVSKLYSAPAIVIDMGTATTFDIINKDKEFIGGIITPGMKIQMQALSEYTSKLPLIEIEPVEKIIGTNTKKAILSGVVRGHACLIEGLLEKCKIELQQKAITIATGGYAKLIANYMSSPFDFIDEDLTLKGLNTIYYDILK